MESQNHDDHASANARHRPRARSKPQIGDRLGPVSVSDRSGRIGASLRAGERLEYRAGAARRK
jgi:hypothetical protein